MDREEIPKGRHSLGGVIQPKRKDPVGVQGGLLPQETVDASRETGRKASGETTSGGLGETNVVSDEVSGWDVCDGRSADKVQSNDGNDGNDGCKGSNEENITQK
jgi:hypothetical protein